MIDRLRTLSALLGYLILTAVIAGVAATARAEAPRVLPAGKLPQDKRLGELKTLNGYFPFQPCDSPEAWAKRAERVRRQMLVATGLWPMPTKTPANAVIHGRIDRDTYTVEKVYLQSFPGHFVTGNLYRPKGRSGRLPGVLCPHGHWPKGRFYAAPDKELQGWLKNGAEKSEISGRSPLQARCVQLARMGCVVFHYDMVGYADSVQLGHGPGVRPHMNTPENWGYFSPQAESRLENMMGLQTYNSIRALDWFRELPDVDAQRIGVTGCSGGGTQTFILCALDPRPAVAFPAVMVSTAMQGGCTCENACYLRIDTGNIEFAALFAPRPLGMTAADDWTKEIATKGLPELKRLYKMLGVEDLVMAKPLLQFPHNYNYVSRAVMYDWFNKYLKLGQPEPIVEKEYKPLTVAEMSVWDEKHPKPAGGDDYERSLLGWITQDSERQMTALVPKDSKSLARYRQVVGGAVDVMIGRQVPAAGTAVAEIRSHKDLGDYRLVCGVVASPLQGEQLPAVFLEPKNWNKRIAIWIDKTGKQCLFAADGSPRPAIRKLLSAGVGVAGVDLFGQGEFTADGQPLSKTRQVNPKYAGYTLGYNHPVFSQRVHDILTMISVLKHGPQQAEKIDLVGLNGAGHWVAAARAQAGPMVDRAVVDTAGFRFARIAALDDPDFLPGGAKYLDLPGILALSAPGAMWLAGEGTETPQVIAAAYRAAGQPTGLTVYGGASAGAEAAAVDWLLR